MLPSSIIDQAKAHNQRYRQWCCTYFFKYFLYQLYVPILKLSKCRSSFPGAALPTMTRRSCYTESALQMTLAMKAPGKIQFDFTPLALCTDRPTHWRAAAITGTGCPKLRAWYITDNSPQCLPAVKSSQELKTMLSDQVQSNDVNIRWSEPLILLLTPNLQNMVAAFYQNTLKFKQEKANYISFVFIIQ